MTTPTHAQFRRLAVLTVMGGFIVGNVLSPPDPFSQLRIIGGLIAVGLAVSVWLVYYSTVDLPTFRWDDLFRWTVSTYLFVFLIALATNFDGAFAFDTLTSRLWQLGVLIVGATLAWVVVYSDRIPWPGDH